MRKTSKASPVAQVIYLSEVRAERAAKEQADSTDRSLLWVSRTESAFLSHMYEFGPEAAAKRLMQMAGKPWPEGGAKPRKAKAQVLDVRKTVTPHNRN